MTDYASDYRRDEGMKSAMLLWRIKNRITEIRNRLRSNLYMFCLKKYLPDDFVVSHAIFFTSLLVAFVLGIFKEERLRRDSLCFMILSMISGYTILYFRKSQYTLCKFSTLQYNRNVTILLFCVTFVMFLFQNKYGYQFSFVSCLKLLFDVISKLYSDRRMKIYESHLINQLILSQAKNRGIKGNFFVRKFDYVPCDGRIFFSRGRSQVDYLDAYRYSKEDTNPKIGDDIPMGCMVEEGVFYVEPKNVFNRVSEDGDSDLSFAARESDFYLKHKLLPRYAPSSTSRSSNDPRISIDIRNEIGRSVGDVRYIGYFSLFFIVSFQMWFVFLAVPFAKKFYVLGWRSFMTELEPVFKDLFTYPAFLDCLRLITYCLVLYNPFTFIEHAHYISLCLTSKGGHLLKKSYPFEQKQCVLLVVDFDNVFFFERDVKEIDSQGTRTPNYPYFVERMFFVEQEVSKGIVTPEDDWEKVFLYILKEKRAAEKTMLMIVGHVFYTSFRNKLLGYPSFRYSQALTVSIAHRVLETGGDQTNIDFMKMEIIFSEYNGVRVQVLLKLCKDDEEPFKIFNEDEGLILRNQRPGQWSDVLEGEGEGGEANVFDFAIGEEEFLTEKCGVRLSQLKKGYRNESNISRYGMKNIYFVLLNENKRLFTKKKVKKRGKIAKPMLDDDVARVLVVSHLEPRIAHLKEYFEFLADYQEYCKFIQFFQKKNDKSGYCPVVLKFMSRNFSTNQVLNILKYQVEKNKILAEAYKRTKDMCDRMKSQLGEVVSEAGEFKGKERIGFDDKLGLGGDLWIYTPPSFSSSSSSQKRSLKRSPIKSRRQKLSRKKRKMKKKKKKQKKKKKKKEEEKESICGKKEVYEKKWMKKIIEYEVRKMENKFGIVKKTRIQRKLQQEEEEEEEEEEEYDDDTFDLFEDDFNVSDYLNKKVATAFMTFGETIHDYHLHEVPYDDFADIFDVCYALNIGKHNKFTEQKCHSQVDTFQFFRSFLSPTFCRNMYLTRLLIAIILNILFYAGNAILFSILCLHFYDSARMSGKEKSEDGMFHGFFTYCFMIALGCSFYLNLYMMNVYKENEVKMIEVGIRRNEDIKNKQREIRNEKKMTTDWTKKKKE